MHAILARFKKWLGIIISFYAIRHIIEQKTRLFYIFSLLIKKFAELIEVLGHFAHFFLNFRTHLHKFNILRFALKRESSETMAKDRSRETRPIN